MHVRNAEIPFLHREIVFRKYSETYITSYTKSIITISHIKRYTDYSPASERIGLEFFNLFHRFYYACICTQRESDYNDQ